jgi:hypothetical protein
MSFIAPAPAAQEADLPHHPFWPAISPAHCRQVMALDGTVTTMRLVFALTEAVVLVNGELKGFRLTAESKGIAMLDQVPDDEPGRLVHLYRRAVYERAKADIMERMIGFSATGDGQKRAEQQDPAIGDHYRNSLWAIRDIIGERRTTAALI